MAALATAAACWGDTSPARAAAPNTGSPVSAWPVLIISAASPAVVPVVLARCWAADLSPPRRHSSLPATTTAAIASIVPRMLRMTATSPMTF